MAASDCHKQIYGDSFSNLQNVQQESQAPSKFAKLSKSSERLDAFKTKENKKYALNQSQLPPFQDARDSLTAVSSEASSAAKPLSLREQIRTLEPINEISSKKFELLAESISGPFTESEVQELLLSYTYTSGMIDGGSKQNSASIANNTAHLRSRIRKKWTNLALGALDAVDKLQSKLYEYFWLCALYLNMCFPKATTFIRKFQSIQSALSLWLHLCLNYSDLFVTNSGLSSFTGHYVVPSCKKSAGLVKTTLVKLVVRFQKKPYSTTLFVIIAIINLIPLLIFVFIMATLSSVYFLIYFVSFLAIATAASFFIIPLLGISFMFASGVVIFGFFSDVTFKFAQSLYIKTDHRLKSTLTKMGNHTKGEQPADLPSMNEDQKQQQQQDNEQFNSTSRICGAQDDDTSAVAQFSEARHGVRVTR